MNIWYFLFKKKIDNLAEEKFKSIVLDRYIAENFFIDTTKGSLEMQFRGKEFIKYMAANFYEIVKDADNYVTMDLNSQGYEPLTVTIQKRWKLSPHEKTKKLEGKLNEACDLLNSCLEWDNGGERDYEKIVKFVNSVEKK